MSSEKKWKALLHNKDASLKQDSFFWNLKKTGSFIHPRVNDISYAKTKIVYECSTLFSGLDLHRLPRWCDQSIRPTAIRPYPDSGRTLCQRCQSLLDKAQYFALGVMGPHSQGRFFGLNILFSWRRQPISAKKFDYWNSYWYYS